MQAGPTPIASAGRIPLSPEASCLSLAHFFELSFGARHLQLSGRPLHSGFARYFGLGQMVACFLFERVECYDVTLPPAEIACQVRQAALHVSRGNVVVCMLEVICLRWLMMTCVSEVCQCVRQLHHAWVCRQSHDACLAWVCHP